MYPSIQEHSKTLLQREKELETYEGANQSREDGPVFRKFQALVSTLHREGSYEALVRGLEVVWVEDSGCCF